MTSRGFNVKRWGWSASCLGCILLVVTPAWAAKKVTVKELEELLVSLEQAKKSDEEVANTLKQIELSEELTRSTMNSLIGAVPGRLSTEQIYVLEARSAELAPPPADLPASPAPDAGQQKAILDRAQTYVTHAFDALPPLLATKTTLRFQDNVEAVAPSSGIGSAARDASTDNGFSNPATFVHYINSAERSVVSDHGAELAPAVKDRTPWGANKMIALEEPDPSLGEVFKEAQAAQSLRWLRWELVSGNKVAVFSYSVPRKNSRLELNVCCFPHINQSGTATFYTSTTAAALAGDEATGTGGGVTGTFQTNTDWHAFKSQIGYHGEIFVSPDSGTVVRVITQAELRPSDVVHRVDRRIDYGSAVVGTRSYIVPLKQIIDTEVVPNGDSGAGTYKTRRTLFTSEYKDYSLTTLP